MSNPMYLLLLVLPIALFAIAIALAAVVIRGRSPENRIRLLAQVTRWGAWGVAALWLAGSAREIFRVLFSASVSVQIGVSPFWPVLPNEVSATPGTAQVETGVFDDGFTQANIHLSGLSGETRGLIALENIAGALSVLILCLLVGRLAGGIVRGRVFDSVRGKDLVIAGAIFFGSGLTEMIANAFRQMAILDEAAPRQFSWDTTSWTASPTEAHTQVFGVVAWAWSPSAPTWPFIAAAVAFIAAMVMRRGNQLETETEGLI